MNNKKIVVLIIALSLMGSNMCLAMSGSDDEGYVLIGEEGEEITPSSEKTIPPSEVQPAAAVETPEALMPTEAAPAVIPTEIPVQAEETETTPGEHKMGRAYELGKERMMPVLEEEVEEKIEADITPIEAAPAEPAPAPMISKKAGRLQLWRQQSTKGE